MDKHNDGTRQLHGIANCDMCGQESVIRLVYCDPDPTDAGERAACRQCADNIITAAALLMAPIVVQLRSNSESEDRAN